MDALKVRCRMINIKPYMRKVNVMAKRSVVVMSVFVGLLVYGLVDVKPKNRRRLED